MIISEQFGDIYFSKNDGLAETRHVYLQGCGLPDAWAGRARFCIGELGFGTGLNFLAAWQLFDATAPKDARLDFVSIEKYPLTPDRIREALSVWRDELGDYLDRFLNVYPMMTPGFHRINLSERVTLTLIFDDVEVALSGLVGAVDAWFLDGFAPAKNPDMWTADVFAHLARLSAHGARLASFTAVGAVRRGLAAAGFDIERVKGFLYKPHMTIGRFMGQGVPCVIAPKRVAVMGAGLAGASVAWHLKRAGVDVCVFDAGAHLGAGASGNRLGLVNPKLTVQRDAQTDFYVAAYDYALRVLGGLNDVDFRQTGSLHLELDADKTRRFAGYVQNLGWGDAHMMRVDAQVACDIAGMRIDVPCMFYADGASVCPKAVCGALLAGVPVQYGVDVPPDGFDVVVYATGAADVLGLDLQPVRGQVTRLHVNDVSAALSVNLGYGGYLSPALDGLHMCGATFQPGGMGDDVLDDDHARNLAQLVAAVPAFADVDWRIEGGWAAVRVACRDRFPMVGRHKDVWVSTAHGSHGLMSGFMAGAVIAAQMVGGVLPISRMSAHALGVDRFTTKL